MVPESPLNKMIPLLEDYIMVGGRGGGGGGMVGIPGSSQTNYDYK